ncbi:MBL fold metallo-hydrolase [Candidatus Omnitrophota bacterium]
MPERLIVEILEVGPFATNCYVVGVPGGAGFIIDPGDEAASIKAVAAKHRLDLRFVINTHGHIDHIKEDASFGLPVLIHSRDKVQLFDPAANLSSFLFTPFVLDKAIEVRTLEDGQSLDLDGIQLEVLHTPGHSPGGICIRGEGYLFSGDTLFSRSIGRTDLKGGDYDQLIRGIKDKLFSIEEDLVVFPGHGPKTTLAEEKRENPFVQ